MPQSLALAPNTGLGSMASALRATGVGGVPAACVGAVIMTLLVTAATAAYFTTKPAGSARPTASTASGITEGSGL